MVSFVGTIVCSPNRGQSAYGLDYRNILVEEARLRRGSTMATGRHYAEDTYAAIGRNSQRVSRPDNPCGAVVPLAIDAHAAGQGELLCERTRLSNARKPEPLVDPLTGLGRAD